MLSILNRPRISCISIVLSVFAGAALPVSASDQNNQRAQSSSASESEVSPSRKIKRSEDRRRDTSPNSSIASIDGSNNHIANPLIGATHTELRRLVASEYADGISEPAGADRPSARAISNIVAAQEVSVENSRNASDFLWQWGQFLDHDIDLSDGIDPPEPFPISVPRGDVHFDPEATGTVEIDLNRTLYDPNAGEAGSAARQQINEISSWIYGLRFGSGARRRPKSL